MKNEAEDPTIPASLLYEKMEEKRWKSDKSEDNSSKIQ